MLGAFLGFMIASPFLVFLAAIWRGMLLFFPTMLMFGVVHDFLPWVPAFGWAQTLAILILLSLLVPTGSTSTTTTRS